MRERVSPVRRPVARRASRTSTRRKKWDYVLVPVMLAERDVADLRHDIDDCESRIDQHAYEPNTTDAPTFDIGPDSV